MPLLPTTELNTYFKPKYEVFVDHDKILEIRAKKRSRGPLLCLFLSVLLTYLIFPGNFLAQ